MGEFKDINDSIYNKLIERLEEEGYENITHNVNHNKIVNLIDSSQNEYEAFEELVENAIKILK